MSNFIVPCNGRITSPFGYRIHPISKTKKMHWGVDYGNTPSDNTIIASADGTVERSSVFDGYGNTIIITHLINGITYQTLYAHLTSMSVKVGDKVKQGQKIGVKGTTGNSTGIHLHFEVHVGGKRNSSYTYAKDPLKYVVDSVTLELQTLLNKFGYKLVVDGISGNATLDAVKDFQKKNGLTVDGIAGAKTLEILKKPTAEVTTTPKPVPAPAKAKGTYRLKTGTFPDAKALADGVAKMKTEFTGVVYEKPESLGFNPEYRIYTGTFTAKEDAEAVGKQLKDKFGWVVYVINETKN